MSTDNLSYKRSPYLPIDYDRCTDCMQGLSFCVFDVDGVGADERRARATARPTARPAPRPALSRDLFPKYSKGRIHGDVVRNPVQPAPEGRDSP
jgi:hypothetical protein